ncbi:MAG: glycosyltransferase [Acidobacteriota bacterium]|nr:glycosyltransferase [Acidobacteriota bacterium]
MTATFHLLTGEYPPQTGGVGDYTRMVADGLVARGAAVHVWCPAAQAHVAGPLHVHRLPDVFGRQSRRMLEAAFLETRGCVIVQYVPNALGARGANVPFCLWLLRMRRQSHDISVMFHEPYFYFSMQRSRTVVTHNALAAVQRLMAALLMRASRVAYISTSAWVQYLRPWGSSPLVESPIPATVAVTAPAACIARWRARFSAGQDAVAIVGHFGTFGDHVGRDLMDALPAILHGAAALRVVLLGRGGEAFAAAFRLREPGLAGRVLATGLLSATDAAAALRACDVVVQPYPDGVTTRRTSVMAALANQVAVVTTDGELTEPVWRETGAVGLAPASDPAALAAATVALLVDTRGRAALAANGRRLYDARFAIEHTLDALLDERPAA